MRIRTRSKRIDKWSEWKYTKVYDWYLSTSVIQGAITKIGATEMEAHYIKHNQLEKIQTNSYSNGVP